MGRCMYRELGGFRDWPLLEDVDLARRLRRAAGPPAIVPAAVMVQC